MAPEGTRRSSRVPKQVAILLIGSDIEGRVFSEKTKTVVLSRHGAGIISEFKLSAEQELVVRCVDSDKEAEVRVVGQIGAQDNTYIYGVAFLNPNLNFWGIEFPALTEAEKAASHMLLQCSGCKTRQSVDQSDLEGDVFAINQSIVRFCKRCGSSTVWRHPSGEPDGEPAERETPTEQAPHLVPVASERSSAMDPLLVLDSSPPAALKSAPTAAPSIVSPPPAPVRPENRRKHARTRVNFKACIRQPGSEDDVVACEDMSRGGLRFKSRRRYAKKAMIQVAVPYSPGDQAIFVPGQIAYVVELPEEKLFRCGVAYMKSSRSF
jgi:hypothetical protein